MDSQVGLGRALGHVRNAANAFWEADDPSGESLFLAADCFDLEGLFSDLGVLADLVELEPDPVVSLHHAADALESARPAVPLAVWAAVQSLRARAAR